MEMTKRVNTYGNFAFKKHTTQMKTEEQKI